MLKNKNILLCISGGIAAFKSISLASLLRKNGANIDVIMTDNARKFINPINFEAICQNKVYTDVFETDKDGKIAHISLAERAELVVLAPATANTIAKLANGLADNMLGSTVLASRAPKLICPAMNSNMYDNKATQDNINKLKSHGYTVLEPAEGLLACGAIGRGRLPEAEVIFDKIYKMIAKDKDLSGKNILINAGATREPIDPVRFITNHSTGKMGYAIANAAIARGANVCLVSGKTALKIPTEAKYIEVLSADDMYEAMMAEADKNDIIIMSAAVADYTPETTASEKIKKSDSSLNLKLKRTKDILASVGKNRRENQIICGFAMETKNLIENARKKLEKKNIDMIVANSLREKGAGFGVDTNKVTIISKTAEKSLPLLSKAEVADKILDEILDL